MRVARNELRKRRVRRWIGLEDAAVVPMVPGHDPIAAETLRRFYAALDRMDASSRVLFVLRHVEGLETRFAHLQVKFKSDHPDSLIDLLVTDVMVSDYSSLLNAFYYTGRPTVHIDPFDITAKSFVHRAVRDGKLRKTCVHQDAAQQWKLDPSEIGGLRASSFDELCSAVERALGDERCCEQRAADFCRRYISKADGTTRERFRKMLEEWP